MLKTGRRILALLTLINLFNYLDRYILVALSPAIKRDLALSDTEVGFLVTAFMFSYFLVSPVFGWLGDRKPRLRLMSLGVGVWSLATAASGLGRSAAQLLGARLFVGVGEAAYGAISPSLLRDLFPKNVAGKVFAVFFMAIPVGSALGFLLGGVLEKTVGWRSAFFVAGVPGLLLAASLLFLAEPRRGAFDEPSGEAHLPLRDLAAALWSNPAYVLTVLGYCAYTFVLGGIAVWIPHYIERYLGVPAADGNMAFGAITVVAGFLGTFVGGSLADRWARTGADAYLKLSALSMFAALPVYLLVMAVRSFPVFCLFTFVLEFLLFLSTSPVNAEIVNCVSPKMRATANAAAIFAIHLLGDAVSPPLVGFVSDRTGSLHAGMMLFAAVIVASGAIWGWKVVGEWEAVPWPEGALRLPRSQCHRGFHERAPENTLAAFRAAAEAGAPMVELDVRLARDGQAVVIHDADIRRVAGREGVVRELTSPELRERAGAPTLREVLEDPACRSLFVNVELKHCPGQNRALAAAVAEAARGFEARVLFSSFNPLLLGAMARLLPGVPRALLATGERDPENKIYLRRMWLAFLARPHMLNYDGRFYTERLARRLAARHVPVALWTVESPEEARKFLAMGAESIISPIPRIV
jgi:glycerophosphoryl diester phosphodiesterase/predicted MFS family arabinose efflux permease